MEYKTLVFSSDKSEQYTITFKSNNDFTSINCTCKAGWTKTNCRHRYALLEHDFSNLVNPNDEEKICEIMSNINFEDIINYRESLAEIEKSIKILNEHKKRLNKDFGALLSNGFTN